MVLMLIINKSLYFYKKYTNIVSFTVMLASLLSINMYLNNFTVLNLKKITLHYYIM